MFYLINCFLIAIEGLWTLKAPSKNAGNSGNMTEKQTEVNKSLSSQDKTTNVCTATAAASISADEIKTEIGADEESSSTIQSVRETQQYCDY